MQWLKQSTAATKKIGPFLDDTDGKTAETGLAIAQADVRLSKNGGNLAQKNEATSCTHDEIGVYGCPLDTTDTNTLGVLQLWVHKSGALPVWHEFMVVPANVWDSMFGSDKLQVDATQIEGSDATDQIRDAVVDDATRIDASALNTLSGHDPGGTLCLDGTPLTAAETESEANDALVALHLDHLLAVDYDPAGKPGTATALLNELVESDVGVSRFTANALEQGPNTTSGLTLHSDYDAAKTAAPANEYDTEIADIPTVAEFNARTQPTADYFDPAADAVAEVTLVTTTTTNTDMRGTDSAALASGVNCTQVEGGDATDAIQAAADAALVANHLDHLLKTTYDPASRPGVADALLNELVESDVGISRFTENALEQAPSGSGGDATEAKQDTIITHLTDVKGGTFAATDSLEAIRDRGDAAWTTGAGGTAGSGAITFIYTLTSSVDGEPIAQADVWVTTDEAGTNVIASGTTSDTGTVTFYLDAGTYYVWRAKSGWDFDNPDTEAVS